MEYQIYLSILFSNDMKKVGFIEPKNTSFLCAATIKQFMTMNPLNT